ncbi:DMT family transporter [Peribacillus sp. NPDC096379]|uniref:DMT family transporter n=1 Tax=Peribacillus sp. NPDC096379 TaxID=3364393 RepID=UPI00380FEC83
MSWVFLIIAGIFEIVGVTGMQIMVKGQKLKGFLIILIGFIISFTLLSLAMKTIPLGVAYAVWTGIGTVGSAIIGMLYYGESKDKLRIFFIALVVVAVIGLRLAS